MTIGSTDRDADSARWVGVVLLLVIVLIEFGVMLFVNVRTVPDGRLAPNTVHLHVTAGQ